jgi:hypothetical protein
VVLDVTLPGIDGFGVMRQLRADRIHTPVLFLTARDSLQDRITGLSIGADDYITKPFGIEEVIARLRAILRRTGIGAQKPRTARLVFADIELDENSHEVARAGVPVSLSPRAFALLRYFVVNAGTVLSKQRARCWLCPARTTTSTISPRRRCSRGVAAADRVEVTAAGRVCRDRLSSSPRRRQPGPATPRRPRSPSRGLRHQLNPEQHNPTLTGWAQ